jgi:hypothetical protein
MKFSHVRRDGIDYVQTSIEGDVSVEMLRAFESSRLLSRQFDNYVVGTIDGGRVSLDVQTVGALATERFTPERWRAVHRYPDSRSLPEKAWALIGTPKRLAAVAVLLGGALGAGFLLGALFGRRRRQPA